MNGGGLNKTSLIITVFNRSHLIRKALLSLKNQSVKPHELILSDDGSTEDIFESIKDIVSVLEFPVKYVRQENKGFRLAKKRNNGVRNSNGDLIIFLDQDLIHTNNLIKTFIENSKEKRFLTGMPIWLPEEKSNAITEDKIINNNFRSLISCDEKTTIDKQFKKDKRYYYLHKMRLTNQPRLRGGVCAINRKDFELINGYDEKFIGWGAEDDDVGNRLYKLGVEGYNPFKDEYTIHLFHEKAKIANKGVKEQANYKYYQEKKAQIKLGNFRAKYGLDNPYDEDTYTITELN
jgi:hypothetical protein